MYVFVGLLQVPSPLGGLDALPSAPVLRVGTGLAGLALRYRYDQFQARQSTREALRTSRSLLRRTEDMATVGGWKYDVSTGRMACTEALYRLFGVPLSFTPDLSATVKIYAPPRVRPVFRLALTRCLEEGRPFLAGVAPRDQTGHAPMGPRPRRGPRRGVGRGHSRGYGHRH